MLEPRLYVGTYGKYVNGSILGKWMSLSDYSDYDEFLTACRELHSDEADPELMYQDFENFPAKYYSESGLDPEFWVWNNLDEHEQEIVKVYLDHVDDSAQIDYILDSYGGCYESPEDWAIQFLEDTCADIPENLRNYIDYEAYARDASYDGMSFVETGYKNCHVFYPH